uniref:Uncharacterized protein n=1 Tax=Triticum urartu TaxID=4572 RepID=A0A8R7UAU2_TRIUA
MLNEHGDYYKGNDSLQPTDLMRASTASMSVGWASLDSQEHLVHCFRKRFYN